MTSDDLHRRLALVHLAAQTVPTARRYRHDLHARTCKELANAFLLAMASFNRKNQNIGDLTTQEHTHESAMTWSFG